MSRRAILILNPLSSQWICLQTLILSIKNNNSLPTNLSICLYASRIVYMKDGKIVGDVKQKAEKVSHVASLANNNGAENKDGFSLNIERLVNYLEISLAPEEKVILKRS